MSLEEECLAYTEINTEQPCTISVVNKNKKTYITQFMPLQPTIYEWNGLVHVSAEKIKPVNTHIYEMLTPYLPLSAIKIRSQEIDTIADYNKALVWLKTIYRQNKEFYVKQAKNRVVLEEPC